MASNQPRRADQMVGVLLMTFGSPATLDDVPAYMTHVRGGRDASPDLVAEFRRRYELVGGSPLIGITRDQAKAVETELSRRFPAGPRFVASVGMRHSPPFIGEAIEGLAAQGIDEIICLIMSPQYSPFIMGGYHRAVDDAVARLASQGMTIHARVAGAWHTNENFLAAWSSGSR